MNLKEIRGPLLYWNSCALQQYYDAFWEGKCIVYTVYNDRNHDCARIVGQYYEEAVINVRNAIVWGNGMPYTVLGYVLYSNIRMHFATVGLVALDNIALYVTLSIWTSPKYKAVVEGPLNVRGINKHSKRISTFNWIKKVKVLM